MTVRVRRLRRRACSRGTSPSRRRFRGAAAWAASSPGRLMPASAWARAGPSFTPSPTKATTAPPACRSRMAWALSSGRQPPRASEMPRDRPRASAGSGRSPLRRCSVRPWRVSSATVPGASSRRASASTRTPRRRSPSARPTVTPAGSASKAWPVKAGLPRRRMRPSTSPSTPWPGWARKPRTSARARPAAASRMPRATGCSESRSRDAARRRVSGSPSTRRTTGRPWVSVPVLSNARCVARARASMAEASRTRRPLRAAVPSAAAEATGVASPRAQGQAMTRRVTAGRQARANSPVCHHHPARVSAESRSTAGTKTADTRSASSWAGAREPWAWATWRARRASHVSRPVEAASSTSAPPWTMAPAMTASPGPLVTGRGSPVSSASSTSATPSRTVPSTGQAEPGRTRSRSPGCTRRVGTSSSEPSSRRRKATAGASFTSASRLPVARWRALTSRNLPVRRKAARAAALSKGGWGEPCRLSHSANTQVTDAPRAMSVSMLVSSRSAWRRARRKKPLPAPKADTAASSACTGQGRWKGWNMPSMRGRVHPQATARRTRASREGSASTASSTAMR